VWAPSDSRPGRQLVTLPSNVTHSSSAAMGPKISEMPDQIVWDHDTLVRFWAYHSKFPENYFSFQKGADVVRRVKRYIPQEASVVDYGCGPGFLLPHLVRAGYR